MIDMIIVGLALVACRRYWLKGYSAGQYDLQEHWDAKADYWLEQEREHENN